MNSRLERFALLGGLLVLTASLQFGAGLLGAGAALFGALVLSVGATLLWLQFELPTARVWLPPLGVSGAVLASTLLLEFGFKWDFAEWFTVVPAAVGSGICMAVMLRSRARCNLCNRRLSGQQVTFRCPRCTMEVCDETCWDFEHRRCALCLEQRVPVLPIGDSWWARVTGPRARQGRCLICLASAEQSDLRACPNCRRMQCRDCWDFNNGECSRCAAALPELPESLRTVVAGTPEETQGFQQ